jgi:hypothetical protein
MASIISCAGAPAFLPKIRHFRQGGQLFKIGRDGDSMGFFPPLALLFFLVGFRCGSVFCLRHPGMIAPIPSGEKPLGFEVRPPETAGHWSRSFCRSFTLQPQRAGFCRTIQIMKTSARITPIWIFTWLGHFQPFILLSPSAPDLHAERSLVASGAF